MEKKKDYYKDYNAKKYAHYRQVRVGGFDPQEVITENGKRTRINPKMEKRIIPFEEIKSLKLDEVGTLHPQLDTEDYFVVGNYLMDFWGAVLGADAVLLYLHLKRYAYGKKDFCFPDLELISLKMDRSLNTIKKYLSILEEHHFVAKFNRYDVTDNNREVSPFFKIRRLIPLITPEMYNDLDPKLQKAHDEFMEQYEGLSLTNELTMQQAVVDELVVGREIMVNKKQKEKIKKVIEEEDKYQYIINRIDDDSKMATVLFHEEVMKKVSKPSYDTWISQLIFFKVRDDYWMVGCANEFVRDWVEERYQNSFKQWFPNVDGVNYNPESEFNFVLMDIIIERMFKNKA